MKSGQERAATATRQATTQPGAVMFAGAVLGLAAGVVWGILMAAGVIGNDWAATLPGGMPFLQAFLMSAGALAGAVLAPLTRAVFLRAD